MKTKPDPAQLYLDLMKKTLLFLLWDEPGTPVTLRLHHCTPVKRSILKLFIRFLSAKYPGLQLVWKASHGREEREAGRVWPVLADTMVGLKRLDNIQFCIESVLQDDVPGDLIETGVWRGGASIFMRAVLAVRGVSDRCVFVADSFEGLPAPNEALYPEDKGDTHYLENALRVSKEQVAANFAKYGLLDEQVIFLKGWFKDTLPVAPIKQLAVMRLDGDMYQSTIEALTSLYPKLSAGGFCIIDDYMLPGCRKAVDDFRAQHGTNDPIRVIDNYSVFWRRE